MALANGDMPIDDTDEGTMGMGDIDPDDYDESLRPQSPPPLWW